MYDTDYFTQRGRLSRVLAFFLPCQTDAGTECRRKIAIPHGTVERHTYSRTHAITGLCHAFFFFTLASNSLPLRASQKKKNDEEQAAAHSFLLPGPSVSRFQSWFHATLAGVSVCALAYSMGTPFRPYTPFFSMATRYR